jgi:hypothetical protein
VVHFDLGRISGTMNFLMPVMWRSRPFNDGFDVMQDQRQPPLRNIGFQESLERYQDFSVGFRRIAPIWSASSNG